MSAPLSAGISIREFARREGCNDKLVRRALEAGKLAAPVSAPVELEPRPHGSALTRRRRDAAEPAEVDLVEFARRVLSGDAPDLAQSEKVKAAAAPRRAWWPRAKPPARRRH